MSDELREKVAGEVEYELGRAIKDWSPIECADRILALLSAPEPAETGEKASSVEVKIPVQELHTSSARDSAGGAPTAAEPEREAPITDIRVLMDVAYQLGAHPPGKVLVAIGQVDSWLHTLATPEADETP